MYGNSLNIIVLFTQKIVIILSKMGLGSGIRIKPIPDLDPSAVDPGSATLLCILVGTDKANKTSSCYSPFLKLIKLKTARLQG